MKPALEDYKRKRDFTRTPEPPPQKRPGQGPLSFVIQKHAARALHYDLRLELDGVLKSWSVPKGPSLDPGDKHLAVMVEDHPLDYASYEGVIPPGEYGAGQVIIWDRGTYSPDESGRLLFDDREEAQVEMRKGLEKGKLSIYLRGEKLKGSFTLVKTRRSDRDWLLIKHRDNHVREGYDVLQEGKSVVSGLTIDDLKMGKTIPGPGKMPLDLKDIPGVKKAPLPDKPAPMLASQADAPFSSKDWIFEPKLDGFRIIAIVNGDRVVLLSRRGQDVTGQYDILVPDLRIQPVKQLVLDGEIIALDEKGKPCFQCLQDYLQLLHPGRNALAKPPPPLIFYVFDILYCNGYDITGVPLMSRKKILQESFRPTERMRLVDYYETEGEMVFRAAVQNGLEGVMAKQRESLYLPGRRSRDWLKFKAMPTAEFVIAGYTLGVGTRADTFGSLLLGYYGDDGRLVYAGNVGTGFDRRLLKELLEKLRNNRTNSSPFGKISGLRGDITWVKPLLVAEVKYAEWTKDNLLRIPVFLRLRDDKVPSEVKRAGFVHPSVQNGKPVKSSPAFTSPPHDLSEQLETAAKNITLDVEGHSLKVTNLDKVLWLATGSHPDLTKRHLLVYLASVAPFLLRHLKDRPLTLNRYPDGINGEQFYQKHWGHPLPDYVDRVNITSTEDGSRSEYLVCNNTATLLWLGQMADIEFHSWFSRTVRGPDRREQFTKSDPPDQVLNYPDFIIFDLDPYLYSGKEKRGDEPALNREGFKRTGEVAVWLKETLDSLKLHAYVKTSGKTGLHVYVPIVRNLTYAQVRSAAGTIGQELVTKHPRAITMEWAVEKRTGKVFFDYNQNVRGKTLACIYSPRSSAAASVSVPLRWEELSGVYPTDFTILTVPARLQKTGDLWADILNNKQDIRVLLDK